jgi:16S rRNA U1498 N3-methylase RsmE
LLQALGFRVVDLGERVLRVEIAITFLLGQLEALSS